MPRPVLLALKNLSSRLLPTASRAPWSTTSPHRLLRKHDQYKQHLAAAVREMSSLNAMGKRLSGKTILVTGASSGIGRSIAQEFARTSPQNLKIIVTARRIDTLKQVASDIEKEVGNGVKVLPVKLDISKPEEVKSLVPNLPDGWRDIDILVNNAGLVKGVDKAPDIKSEDMEIMFSTNVTGLINMTQAVLPIMKAKKGDNGEDVGGRGDVIMIGSIAGREGYQGGSIYCATKAAVRTFTDALRRELIATRIRIIEVDPGQVETVRLPCPVFPAFFCGPLRWKTRIYQLTGTFVRNSPSFASTVTSPRLMRYTRASSP